MCFFVKNVLIADDFACFAMSGIELFSIPIERMGFIALQCDSVNKI